MRLGGVVVGKASVVRHPQGCCGTPRFDVPHLLMLQTTARSAAAALLGAARSRLLAAPALPTAAAGSKPGGKGTCRPPPARPRPATHSSWLRSANRRGSGGMKKPHDAVPPLSC